jgi:cytochrome P450
MLTVDRMADKLSSNVAVALLGGLVALPLAWKLLAASNGDELKSLHGTRKAVRPATTKPVLGNTLDIIRNLATRHDWIASLCEQAKGEPVLLQSLGTPDMTLLSTPGAFEDVFKNQFDNFPKGPKKSEYLRELLGEGIFAVDNEKWYRQRKTASNLFTTRALRESMTSTIQRHLVVLERIFSRAAEAHDTLDMFRLLNRFTMEAFTEIGFGVHMNCLESDQEHPFQTAFDRSQQFLALRFIRPSWFWKTQRLLGVGAEGQLQQDMKVINSTIFDIVTKTLQQRAKGAVDPDDKAAKDIISLFLDDLNKAENVDESCFDPSYLRDIVVNFIIAGRDTTAQALSWFFYCLSRNAQVETKIREELAAKLPQLQNGQCSPSMDDVSELTYVEAALRETLRLYPSVPIVSKEAVHDAVLSDGTFIAAGSMAALPMYALGRMPHVWGPDAAEFKPERWIDSATGKLTSVSAFKFVAFNAGPRLCLGKNLAMLEMKLIVASLLSKYHVELQRPEDVTYAISFTLPVKGQLNARVSTV